MTPSRRSRYSTTRQKACQHCSTAKAKCDRKELCGRCDLRGLTCSYPSTASHQQSRDSSIVDDGFEPLLQMDLEPTPSSFNQTSNTETATLTPVQTPAQLPTQLPTQTSSTQTPTGNGLNFTALDLVCPISSDDIKNRWLNSYVPLPGQTPKEPPSSITNFVCRMLKSYASMVIKGRLPPFIHPMQASLAPLSACFTLVRMCKPLPGSESVAADILQREMRRLYEELETCDGVSLLGVFQAYLIYSMVLFFHLGPSMPVLRHVMINLQEIACLTCRQGLACVAEQQGIRPRWEAWIVAEAKRRTLFTMYFLDNVLSAHDGSPIYLATELRGVYLPSSKTLWQADRVEWERNYNSHLVECAGEPFRIDELWPFPDGLSEDDIVRQRGRVDQWLEDVDEFGTMLYAAASCTHGG